MKNKNDNNENSINCSSPNAGIHATDDTNNGCVTYINVLNKASLDGIKNFLRNRNNKHATKPKSNTFDK